MRHLVLEATPSFASIREQVLAQPRNERALLLLQPAHLLPDANVLLVLLRRLADREHLELGLVTDNRGLRRQALSLGLPAFRNLQSAERHEHIWSQTLPREHVGLPQPNSRRPAGAGYG